MSMQKQANEILSKLAAAEAAPAVVVDVATLCKAAQLDNALATYAVTFAKEAADYLKLTTEELVKKALARFTAGRNTDDLFKGIKSAAQSDAHLALSALHAISDIELKSAADAALADALISRLPAEKQASVDKSAWAWGQQAWKVLKPALKPVAKAMLPAAGAAAAMYGLGKANEGLQNWRNRPALDMMQNMAPKQLADQMPQLMQMAQSGGLGPEGWEMFHRAMSYQQNPYLRGW